MMMVKIDPDAMQSPEYRVCALHHMYSDQLLAITCKGFTYSAVL